MDRESDSKIPQVQRLNAFSGAVFTPTLHHDTYDFISPSKGDLSGRTVLITGASKGIGRNMAISYTQARISGLFLVARSGISETVKAVENAAKSASLPVPKVVAVKMDVTDEKSVSEGIVKFNEAFPDGLDILVSNAGYLEPDAFYGDSDPFEWWKSMEINLKGPYLTGRAVLPLLFKKTNGLKIICNVTSIGAHMLLPGMSAYNTAKLALCRFTEYQDAEYAAKGLIAMTIHPGGVITEMGKKLPEEKRPYLTDTPELPADTVVWLTREKREWLGGRYVSVQWDMNQLENGKDKIVREDLLKVKLHVGDNL